MNDVVRISRQSFFSTDDYEREVGCREYWDSFAHEYKYSSIEEKIVWLAICVQNGGNLKKVLNRYAKDRDYACRREIQTCMGRYILKITTDGEKYITMTDDPLVNRIKRLKKDELVKLFAYLLKKNVWQSGRFNGMEEWTIAYRDKLSPDRVLDKMEIPHWRANPDESWLVYLDRANTWWDCNHSLW